MECTIEPKIAINYQLVMTDSCFIVALEKIDVIEREPFVLSCGETLNVGDEFTQLGTKKPGCSSRGFENIQLVSGWRQRMEGRFRAPFPIRINEHEHDFILMSAWNDEGKSALEGLKLRYKHTFMAYTAIYDGDLHFANRGCASRLVLCNSLTRC